MELPLIFSAHHASYDFGTFGDRCALTLEERKRYCDLGTDMTVPRIGQETLVAEYSRGLIDLNRAPDESTLFPFQDFAKPLPKMIWKYGQAPSAGEQRHFIDTIYTPYHSKLHSAIESASEDVWVVAWDNTAHYMIGRTEDGQQQMMKPIILSNYGKEDRPDGPEVTCDPEVLQALGAALLRELKAVELPAAVYYNHIFFGGFIARRYTNYKRPNTFATDHGVQSLQFEYDMSITHDEKSLAASEERVSAFKAACQRAFTTAFS